METKINIAKILKDKLENTKLYSPLFGDVYFYYVGDDLIKVTHHGGRVTIFFNDGRYYNYPESEPLLLPSKEMRDWRKFAWKKGDVLVGKYNVYIIFEGFTEDTYIRFKGRHYLCKECGEEDYSKKEVQMLTSFFRKANDDEAQTYINTIEERLGGKLNLETLEIEKQPEFKDGDIVLVESYMLGINTNSMIAIFRKEKEIDEYKFSPALCESIEHDTYLREDPVVLSPSDIMIFRPATDSEKQQLFSALAKEGKAWDAEKKQIVDLKPKWTPKPFDRVITRGGDDSIWTANIFSHIDRYGQYVTIGCIGGYPYCIPYNEETAKLIGTTKDVEG